MRIFLTTDDHNARVGQLPKRRSLRQTTCCLNLLVSCWLVCCLTAQPAYSQTAPTPTENPPPTTAEPQADLTAEAPTPRSRDERDNQLLALAAADEVVWLDTSEGKLLARFRPTENGVVKGILLLLHTAETSSGWPAPLENLRRNLPQHGWATLALTLPPQYALATPKRESTEVSKESPKDSSGTIPPAAESTDPASPPAPPEEQIATPAPPVTAVVRADLIARRVAAAMEFLHENNQLTVTLLVDNSSVYDSLQHLTATTQAADTPLQALILVNLQAQELLGKEQLSAIFSSPQLAVMDVFLTPDNTQQILTRKRHRAEALRNQLDTYQQFILPPPGESSVNNARSFWLERVRGFMEQHARK